MTSVRVRPQFENHLWYPVLVQVGGCTKIIEMRGDEINQHHQPGTRESPLSRDVGSLPVILCCRLIMTTRRLTFDIIYQDSSTIYMGDDDGEYYTFTASNGYEVISRSRMDIQTERIWLLGARHVEESRSGTMVFSSDQKRDKAYRDFCLALHEWAEKYGGRCVIN